MIFQWIIPADAPPFPEWVHERLRLPSTSARPGPMVLEPWQLQVADNLFTLPGVHALMIASGAGKTTLEVALVLYIRECMDGDIQLVYPTDTLWRRDLITKWMPILNASPGVREHYRLTPSGDLPDENIRHRRGNIVVGYSTSRASMQGNHLPHIFGDELDEFKWPEDGDPVDNMLQRTVTFRGREHIFLPSTPKALSPADLSDADLESMDPRDVAIARAHGIYRWFLKGDQRRQLCPCYHCNEPFYIEWSQVADGMLHCPHCTRGISTRQRDEMLEAAELTPTADPRAPDTYSYHVSQMASRLVSLESTCTDFKRYTLSMFHQQCLGWPYQYGSSAVGVEPHQLEPLLKPERRTRPECITVGCDVGAREIWYMVQGWWDGERYSEIWETDRIARSVSNRLDLKPFGELRRRLAKYRPQMVMIDANYDMDVVCDAARKIWAGEMSRDVPRFAPIVGDTRTPSKINYETYIDPNRRRLTHGVMGYRLNTQRIKDDLSDWTADALAGEDIWRIVEPDVPADILDQLTAEHKINESGEWMWVPKTPSADNHLLDCRIYGMAARRHVGDAGVGARLEIPADTGRF